VEAWEAGGGELGREAGGGAWTGAHVAGVGREAICREVAGVDEVVVGREAAGRGEASWGGESTSMSKKLAGAGGIPPP